ncbi:MAG: cysteine synthase A [Clostridia bacterium]|nr:cysteine synthase A [Clostridia bacterium]
MSDIYSSIDQMIGKTPLVRLSHVEDIFSLRARLLAKVESMNPTGSVKDRAALYMLNDAEARGLISAGATIIEPTSGNTGIGLCAICATRSYRAIIVMPENMSRERQLMMRAYGAEVVLTPASLGMRGAIEKAKALHAEIPNSFIPSQFDNEANAKAHYETTGPEIFEDTDGEIDIFVAGVGTGGTLMGTGKYLKEKKPEVHLVAVEPEGSAVLSGRDSGAHKIQGIGAGFIPALVRSEYIDEICTVTDADAYAMQRMLAQKEGILAGFSSGAALCAAIRLGALPENEGKTIVVLLPDTGERYLSELGG